MCKCVLDSMEICKGKTTIYNNILNLVGILIYAKCKLRVY